VRRASVSFHLASFLTWGKAENETANALVDEARTLFEEAGETRRALYAANEQGYLRAIAGDLAAHERIAREVLARAEELDDGPLMLQAICSLVWALQSTGRISESVHFMQRGLDVARREGRPYRITYLLSQQGFGLAILGRMTQARAALADAVASNPAYMDTLLPDFATAVHWLAGDLHDAVAATRQSIAPDVTELSQRRLLGAAVALIAATEANSTADADLLQQLIVSTLHGDWWFHSGEARWALALWEARQDNVAAATEHLIETTRRLVDIGSDLFARLALFDLADLALEHSDRAAAAAIDEMCKAIGAPDGHPLSALATMTGAAARLTRAEEVEIGSLDEAVDDLRCSDWKLHYARALVILGRAHAGNDNQAAIECLSQALDLFAACDATPRRDACLQLLDRLGPRGKRVRTATTGPGALTSRELEVVQLAIEGLPTREIGERLFIGRRTVETHLTNAYAKLGIRSRVELVRIADQIAQPATP
jgi:DNA-binding CsgD family transcriptional regulator